MIEKLKQNLRIKHSAMDPDLADWVSACKADLKRIGIAKIEDTDPLIVQCCKLYVRWQVNFEGEADRYRVAYEALRDAMSLSGDYDV